MHTTAAGKRCSEKHEKDCVHACRTYWPYSVVRNSFFSSRLSLQKMQRHQHLAQRDLLQVDDRAGNARHRGPSTSGLQRHRPNVGAGRGIPSPAPPQTPPAPPARPEALRNGGAGPQSRPPSASVCTHLQGSGEPEWHRTSPADLNLDVPAGDRRRIEVVANSLPIWQGAQIAVDVHNRERSPAGRPAPPRQARRCRLVVFGVGSWRAGQPWHPNVLATARGGASRYRDAQRPLDKP